MDADLLELLGDGVDQTGALPRSNPAAAADALICTCICSLHIVPLHANLSWLAWRPSRVCQVAFLSTVRHFAGVVAFSYNLMVLSAVGLRGHERMYVYVAACVE